MHAVPKSRTGIQAGRPRGSRNKASIRMQEPLEQKAELLVDKAVNMAIAGKIGAPFACA
jgi:hypothetical protein